jgi:hypothetical protein
VGMCKDPRLTYLNDSGYNVIRLPRRGIVPLGVIGKDRDAKAWLGTLDQIWESDLPVPTPGPPDAVAGLSGKTTSDIKLSLGLTILANALNGMFGATAPSLDVAYKRAKSVQFAFREVRVVRIDPFAVGNFLGKGDLRPNVFARRYFSGQRDIEALVVTEVLEAKAIGVIAKADATTEVAVNVPEIQAMLGAKVGVSAANAASTDLTYEGPEFLAFGYKAFGIGMQQGAWQIYGAAENADLAFALGAGPTPIVDRDGLVDVSFDAPTA